MFFENSNLAPSELNKQMIQFISLGQYRAVESLLKEGCVDPNFSDNKQELPLIMAAKRNSADIMELLIQYGAEVNQCVTASGKSRLLMYAEHFKNDQMMNLVINAQKASGMKSFCYI